MKIGLTYDLKSAYQTAGYSDEAIAEFDSEDTIQALSSTLAALGHSPLPIGNIFDLVREVQAGHTWDLVFNIAEGLHGRSREAQIPALLEAYQIPYTFSDALTLALSLDKAMCKHLVRASGIATPDFFVVEDPADTRQLLSVSGLDFPLFAKPIAEGTGKGISAGSKLLSSEELGQKCHDLLAKFHQPVLVERFLPGREFTVGILGTGAEARSLGVLEIQFLKTADAGIYTYMNKKDYQNRMTYTLVKDQEIITAANALALSAYRALGCRDAGRVDLRADAGNRLSFLEINPLAGLHPVDSDLPILCRLNGLSYESLIAGIVASASQRLPGVNSRLHSAGLDLAPDFSPEGA